MLCTHAKFHIWNHTIRRLPIIFSTSSHYANDQKQDFELFSENQLTHIQYKFGLIHCTDTKIAHVLVNRYFPNRFHISFIPNKVWFLLFHSPEQFSMKNFEKNLKFKEYFHHSCSFQCILELPKFAMNIFVLNYKNLLLTCLKRFNREREREL